MSRALILLLLIPAAVSASTAYGVAVYGGEGVPVAVKVEVAPGGGSVTIRGLWYYDQLLNISTVVACWEAAAAAGLNPLSYNYTVYIKPFGNASNSIVGPSLSLAVFLSAYSALTGVEINSSIAATGAVTPGGLVDFVGGLPEKAFGARAYGFRLLLYPLLQRNKYQIVLKPKLYGVYGSVVQELVVEPQKIGEIIPAEEVGNVIQAVYIAQNKLYNISRELELFDAEARRIVEKASAPNATGLIQREAWRFINLTLETAGSSPAVVDKLKTAAAYLQLGGLLAPEASVRAFKQAATLYFYIKLLQDGEEALREMDIYATALLTVAEKVVERTPLGYDNLCEASYAHMYLHLAKRQLGDVNRYASLYAVFKSPTYAAVFAYAYGEVLANLWRAILYAQPAAKAAEVDAQAFYKYVEAAVRYAELYSYATNIQSPLVDEAKINLYRAAAALWSNNTAAALGYLQEALTNAIAYFALHPAFPNTTALKYIYYAAAAARQMPENYLTAAQLAQIAVTPVNETRIYHLARIQACRYLYLFTKPTGGFSTTPEAEAPPPKAPTFEAGGSTAIYIIATLAVITAVQLVYWRYRK